MNQTKTNLIPNIPNPSPDYYCTWQTQLYATCDGKPVKQREIIDERSLFDQEKPYGWAYFYEPVRQDLFLVMDDSWDVPLSGDSSYYGSLVLNEEKFPEAVRAAGNSAAEGEEAEPEVRNRAAKANTRALRHLVERMKALGWKGLGGWICAQESKLFLEDHTEETYWIERLKQAEEAGFSYWKVDWGEKAGNLEFRKKMTAFGKQYAPDLVIEHAIIKEILPDCDVFRTYDVPAIMSIPMTMQKLAALLLDVTKEQGSDQAKAGDAQEKSDCSSLINCEDEVYIAAAGGFAMGVMRHPYRGEFVNGKPDMAFPEVHRNLKTKMYEVIRAAKWHRLAPAFDTFQGTVSVEEQTLCDSWNLEKQEEELENWWLYMPIFTEHMEGNTVKQYAPAQIARNCALAYVEPDAAGRIPYIVSSKNPNGVFSIVTLGRTQERTYEIPRCNVTVEIGEAKLLGVFGEYENLTVKMSGAAVKSVLMQDIAGEAAYDVTADVKLDGDTCVIPGDLIHKIGTSAQPADDTSEPGVVICF